MAHNWCSYLGSSRPPENCMCFPAKDARRVLASGKASLCCQTLQCHCPHRIHSGNHFLAYSNEGGYVDGLHLVLLYSWDFQYRSTQELTSLVRRLNLVTTYSGRRRNFSAKCYKRSCEAITIICLQTLKTFLREYEYHYSLDGNNMFVFCHALGPI